MLNLKKYFECLICNLDIFFIKLFYVSIIYFCVMCLELVFFLMDFYRFKINYEL